MRVVRGNKDTDCKGTEDIEEKDTPENSANCLGNVLPRILGFTCGNRNKLDTTVGESSVYKHGEEAQEATCVSC